ncbi:MAG: hypothetical protein LLG04_09175 [Parachlamydia sp.]|nr:hypothetical protein [Parachlamydia sp.]
MSFQALSARVQASSRHAQASSRHTSSRYLKESQKLSPAQHKTLSFTPQREQSSYINSRYNRPLNFTAKPSHTSATAVKCDFLRQAKVSKPNQIVIKMDPTQRRQMATLNSGHSEQYQTQLLNQLVSIVEWRQYEDSEKKKAIWKFMDAIGNLYMDYFHDHQAQAKASLPLYKENLKHEFRQIIRLYVHQLMFRLENADELEEPWDIACRGRTNIEAFNAMFGEAIDTLPTTEIEKYMQAWKGRISLNKDEVPKNALKSHWWWFNDYYMR